MEHTTHYSLSCSFPLWLTSLISVLLVPGNLQQSGAWLLLSLQSCLAAEAPNHCCMHLDDAYVQMQCACD